MFGWIFPRYPRHVHRHYRHHGLGRGLFWGLLIGPWLFRRAMRWGAGQRGWYGGSGRGYGGYGRGSGRGYGGPRYF